VAGRAVTVPAVATIPVIRALLDEAGRKKGLTSGVIAVRARPEWTGAAEFQYEGMTVRVVPCVSALAAWEAITSRARDQWLVLLTDREDDDLGAGIRAHLVGRRLRTPDPWAAVRERFAATGLDPSLTSGPAQRDIATGLLAAAPAGGWPPAPAGVLTRDHAFTAVAAEHLGFSDPVVDLASVLAWTTEPALATLTGDLRQLAGSTLADAVLGWAAERCGAVAWPVGAALRAGDARDSVPLGLVAGLLAGAVARGDADRVRIGREGLIRLEPRIGVLAAAPSALEVWAAESAAVLLDLHADPLRHDRAQALLNRADELLAGARGEAVADDSDWLRTGLARRLAALADVLRQALAGPEALRAGRPDDGWLTEIELSQVEQAWSRVAQHRLAVGADGRIAAFHAAVRLVRYLSAAGSVRAEAGLVAELTALVERHLRNDAWADSAVNDAAPGVGDADLAAGLTAVLGAVVVRRWAHDGEFARALARWTAEPAAVAGIAVAPGLWHIEDLLPKVVFPVARQVPALLLVLDGLAASNATEIVADILALPGEGWAEARLPRAPGRAAALAALPTITEASRASLLTGQLTTGGQEIERTGYAALCAKHDVTTGTLIHKAALDSSLPGEALGSTVKDAIADVARRRLVTGVLNTIDDALDRSDPGGTEWTASAVRHLRPLLNEARLAGRVVILTSDHGHVVERRQGAQRWYEQMTSNRSRSLVGAGDGEIPAGEVLVRGERVLLPERGGATILAVDERVRFGPLKAGYHGGASPAEVIVPVVVLVSGAVPDGVDLELAPPQEPEWWTDPVILAAPGARTGRVGRDRRMRAELAHDPRLRSAVGATEPTLFDLPERAASPDGTAADTGYASGADDEGVHAREVAAEVIRSASYKAARRISVRLAVSDSQITHLLIALLSAAGRRITPVQAAAVLGVAPAGLRGAILHAQRLLNVEGYPVLRVDADGSTVVLDEPLLREQFGLSL
jgi:hypothetical protein